MLAPRCVGTSARSTWRSSATPSPSRCPPATHAHAPSLARRRSTTCWCGWPGCARGPTAQATSAERMASACSRHAGRRTKAQRRPPLPSPPPPPRAARLALATAAQVPPAARRTRAATARRAEELPLRSRQARLATRHYGAARQRHGIQLHRRRRAALSATRQRHPPHCHALGAQSHPRARQHKAYRARPRHTRARRRCRRRRRPPQTIAAAHPVSPQQRAPTAPRGWRTASPQSS
mmetsp:Transcript_2685/g.6063  ORF Transcript_2685/g.6063 Transcript_2685/m.6063 type:complete len:236 (-) Transcript_2685:358-1065(-)